MERWNAAAQWYVVAVEPANDYRARDGLRRAGVEVFLPSLLRITHYRRVRSTSREPLFPGYQFVRLALDDASGWQRALRANYVVGLLPLERPQFPRPVADALIVRIQADAGADETVRPRRLRKGDAVRVTTAFGELRGVYEMWRGADRNELLVDMLGRSVRIEAPDRLVAAAPS